MELEKIRAITECPISRNVTKVRSFLDLVDYYQKYVENFSRISRAMFELLKKGVKFLWKDMHTTVSEELKK